MALNNKFFDSEIPVARLTGIRSKRNSATKRNYIKKLKCIDTEHSKQIDRNLLEVGSYQEPKSIINQFNVDSNCITTQDSMLNIAKQTTAIDHNGQNLIVVDNRLGQSASFTNTPTTTSSLLSSSSSSSSSSPSIVDIKQHGGQLVSSNGGNNREKWRQQNVNRAFISLRRLVPTHPPDKRLSKHEILRMAIKYIRLLEWILAPNKTQPTTLTSTTLTT